MSSKTHKVVVLPFKAESLTIQTDDVGNWESLTTYLNRQSGKNNYLVTSNVMPDGKIMLIFINKILS